MTLCSHPSSPIWWPWPSTSVARTPHLVPISADIAFGISASSEATMCSSEPGCREPYHIIREVYRASQPRRSLPLGLSGSAARPECVVQPYAWRVRRVWRVGPRPGERAVAPPGRRFQHAAAQLFCAIACGMVRGVSLTMLRGCTFPQAEAVQGAWRGAEGKCAACVQCSP